MRVCLEVGGGVVRSLEVSGDFFLSPEYVLDDLREAVEGRSVEEALKTLRDALHAFGGVVESAGITWREVLDCIARCLTGFRVPS